MQSISAEIVTKTWQELGQMLPQDIPQLVNRMAEQQPLLLAYLMVVDQDILNQEEQELQLYLGIAVWQMMEQGDKELVEINENRIEKMEQRNQAMLERLEHEPEVERAVEMMFEDYNQKEVLRYVFEALFEEESEKEEKIREEMKEIIAINLKTIIDCLDQ